MPPTREELRARVRRLRDRAAALPDLPHPAWRTVDREREPQDTPAPATEPRP